MIEISSLIITALKVFDVLILMTITHQCTGMFAFINRSFQHTGWCESHTTPTVVVVRRNILQSYHQSQIRITFGRLYQHNSTENHPLVTTPLPN